MIIKIVETAIAGILVVAFPKTTMAIFFAIFVAAIIAAAFSDFWRAAPPRK